MEQCISPGFRTLSAESSQAEQDTGAGSVWLWHRRDKLRAPGSGIHIRRPLLRALYDDLEVSSVEPLVNVVAVRWAMGVLLTSTSLPALLCFPRLKDGVVHIHCILIRQEGHVECPKQLWRPEREEKGGDRNFIILLMALEITERNQVLHKGLYFI